MRELGFEWESNGPALILEQPHGIAHGDAAAAQNARVDPAPARVALLVDPMEAAAEEGVADVLAGLGVAGDFELHVGSKLQPRSGSDGRPVEPRHGDVLAEAARLHRMALGGQSIEELLREQTNRPVWAAVDFQVALPIAHQAAGRHFCAGHGALWHAAVRDADLTNPSGHRNQPGGMA